MSWPGLQGRWRPRTTVYRLKILTTTSRMTIFYFHRTSWTRFGMETRTSEDFKFGEFWDLDIRGHRRPMKIKKSWSWTRPAEAWSCPDRSVDLWSYTWFNISFSFISFINLIKILIHILILFVRKWKNIHSNRRSSWHLLSVTNR